MRYFDWLLRAMLFIALLGLAVKNGQIIALHYFFDYEWHAPLVFLLLLFFAAGAAIGIMAMFTTVLRQRREIARLRQGVAADHGSVTRDEKQSLV
jgi:uncharacterized integral membrane protein